MLKSLIVILSTLLMLALVSCGENESSLSDQEVTDSIQLDSFGALEFVVNGEDFVRSGFVSVDGWHITFDHVYVTISDVSAYQTDPPYDPHSSEEIVGSVEVGLENIFTVDLAEGDENADPIFLGVLESVPIGHYNAMSWSMIPAVDGPATGYSIYIEAHAAKDDLLYEVSLGIEDRYKYYAGEFVGDVRKGFVTEENAGDLEMTFHFDHVFGDIDQPIESSLNTMAIGFEPFAELMQEGTIQEDLASLSENMEPEIYSKLLEILPTLGHTGEGHCHCIVIQ